MKHIEINEIFKKIAEKPRLTALQAKFSNLGSSPTFKIIKLLSDAGMQHEIENILKHKDHDLERLYASFLRVQEKFAIVIAKFDTEKQEQINKLQEKIPLSNYIAKQSLERQIDNYNQQFEDIKQYHNDFLRDYKKQIHCVARDFDQHERITKNKELDKYEVLSIKEINQVSVRKISAEEQEVNSIIESLRFKGRRFIPIPFFGTITDMLAIRKLQKYIDNLELYKNDDGSVELAYITDSNNQINKQKIKIAKRRQKEIMSSVASRFVVAVALSEGVIVTVLGVFGLPILAELVFAVAASLAVFYLLRKPLAEAAKSIFYKSKSQNTEKSTTRKKIIRAITALSCGIAAFICYFDAVRFSFLPKLILMLHIPAAFCPPALLTIIAIMFAVSAAIAISALFTSGGGVGNIAKIVKNFFIDKFVTPIVKRQEQGAKGILKGVAIVGLNVVATIIGSAIFVSAYALSCMMLREQTHFILFKIFKAAKVKLTLLTNKILPIGFLALLKAPTIFADSSYYANKANAVASTLPNAIDHRASNKLTLKEQSVIYEEPSDFSKALKTFSQTNKFISQATTACLLVAVAADTATDFTGSQNLAHDAISGNAFAAIGQEAPLPITHSANIATAITAGIHMVHAATEGVTGVFGDNSYDGRASVIRKSI